MPVHGNQAAGDATTQDKKYSFSSHICLRHFCNKEILIRYHRGETFQWNRLL